MRPLGVIVLHVLFYDISQMTLSKYQHLVQALALNAPDKPFDDRI